MFPPTPLAVLPKLPRAIISGKRSVFLSIPQELRRIKNAEAYANFAKFSEALRKRVQQKMLARTRRRIGDPKWKPAGMISGMAFEYEVSRELRKVYERIG